MEQIETIAVPEPVSIDLEVAAEASARRYIDAIVERDRLTALLGAGYRLDERARLWASFTRHFSDLVTGPYARPHREALRIALSAL